MLPSSGILPSQIELVRIGRRGFLTAGAFAAAHLATSFWNVRGAFAEELSRTPKMTEGPFYPDRLPLDTDNDLLIVNDSLTPAIGEITHLSGRILDRSGEPIRNALVEIWQVDGRGVYLHSRDRQRDNRDSNFQGFGRFLTGTSGEYYFRTVKPVPYPGRTPHIHVKVFKEGREQLTTQFFVKGEPLNERDGIYRGLSEQARASVTAEFAPLSGSRIGELTARVDVVLGVAPRA